MYWIEFIISAAVIVAAGSRLTTFADKLSDKLNLGKVWIGIVLLGFVTSLPEAITCLVSVISLQANDLAVGNILGSNNFNPILIVVMDLFYRSGSVTNAVEPKKSHAVSGFLAILLTLLIVVEIGIQPYVSIPVVFHVSLLSLCIAVVYFVGMKYLSTLESEGVVTDSSAVDQVEESLACIIGNLLVTALVVIVSAMFLAHSANTIAEQTGLGQTFVGTILLALVTSLPELVVSLSALKLGSFDLAIGNIFGSNMGNVFILFICDVFYTKGSLFESVSSTHIFTGLLSVVISLVVLWGLHRKKKTFGRLGLDSIIMLILFISGVAVLFHLR